MSETVSAFFTRSMQERAEAMAEACTHCGACFRACPMTGPAGLGDAAPEAVTSGIANLLVGGAGTPDAVRWAEVCTGSGFCIGTCEHGINPRFMVQLARGFARHGGDDAAARAAGQRSFSTMARLARVMSRLHLSPENLTRLTGLRPDPARERPPEVVFYTGCNVPRTPHIVLLVLDILDRLEVDYEVTGGTGNCCGVLQFRAGDFAATGRVASSTIAHLAEHRAPTVLSWCPSCQIQFTEVALPSYAEAHEGTPFDMQPILLFLAARADKLRSLMLHRVEKRVALHERPAIRGAMDAVKTLLGTVPGLEFVEIDVPRVGVQASSMGALPAFKRALIEAEFARVAEAGVDTLATVYHACHRDICTMGEGVSFEVLNFLELIGAGLGIVREDLYRRLKLLEDIDDMIADSLPMMEANRIDVDTARAALMAEFHPPR